MDENTSNDLKEDKKPTTSDLEKELAKETENFKSGTLPSPNKQTHNISEDISVKKDKFTRILLLPLFIIFILLAAIVSFFYVKNINIVKPNTAKLPSQKGSNEEQATQSATTDKQGYVETRTSSNGEYFMRIVEDKSEGPCFLNISVYDKNDQQLDIEGYGEAISGLSCNNYDIPQGFENPFPIRVSEWSTIDDTFIVDLGEQEDNTIKLSLFRVENNSVSDFSDFYVSGNVIGYIPSLRYVLMSDYKVFNTTGRIVSVFQPHPGTGEASGIQLIKDYESFLITSQRDTSETSSLINEYYDEAYMEYYYLFDPDTESFYLAGSKEFVTLPVGCPQSYAEIDKENKSLTISKCVRKETVDLDLVK